jgi:hypothetical protein
VCHRVGFRTRSGTRFRLRFRLSFETRLEPSFETGFAASDVRSDALSFGPSDALCDATSLGLSSVTSFRAGSVGNFPTNFPASFVGRSQRPSLQSADCSLQWRNTAGERRMADGGKRLQRRRRAAERKGGNVRSRTPGLLRSTEGERDASHEPRNSSSSLVTSPSAFGLCRKRSFGFVAVKGFFA